MERRLSLFATFLSFEFSGGRSSAPPPAVRRWLRTPAVRGLQLPTAKEGNSFDFWGIVQVWSIMTMMIMVDGHFLDTE